MAKPGWRSIAGPATDWSRNKNMVDAAYSETKSDRILLFVHGCDFKPAPGELLDICIAAVKAGISRDHPESIDKFDGVEKRLAYYGDVTNAFFEERGRNYDAALDVGDRRNALQSLSAIDKRKNFGVHRYDRVPGKTAVGEFAATVVGPVLGRLGMSKAIISKLCVDLGEYWNDKSTFDESLRSRVRDAIVEALNSDKRLMLLSHGTGCVVAYDVLWELSNDPQYSSLANGRKVDTWLTAGAPLGDSLISSRLKGASVKGPGRYPHYRIRIPLSNGDGHRCQ